ncbi:unnamed protein product [Closterium sp. NIES-54]
MGPRPSGPPLAAHAPCAARVSALARGVCDAPPPPQRAHPCQCRCPPCTRSPPQRQLGTPHLRHGSRQVTCAQGSAWEGRDGREGVRVAAVLVGSMDCGITKGAACTVTSSTRGRRPGTCKACTATFCLVLPAGCAAVVCAWSPAHTFSTFAPISYEPWFICISPILPPLEAHL